jgi:16S rRNA (guanine1207-N2)-methyltransferase
MASEQYFSSNPESDPHLRQFHTTLAGRDYELTTASGIFSPERIDAGTRVLLAHTPPGPPGGDILDLGCGWGPITLTLALEAPHATVWAVDVNRFTSIRSNPPIRVGKDELHAMLLRWLPRLEEGSDAWLVVQKNLGSDSLHRWLDGALSAEFTVSRAATNKGYRVLRVRRRAGAGAQTSITPL